MLRKPKNDLQLDAILATLAPLFNTALCAGGEGTDCARPPIIFFVADLQDKYATGTFCIGHATRLVPLLEAFSGVAGGAG